MSQVHRDLQELAYLHLVESVDDGQAKRPVVWYDTIDIGLPLGSPVIDVDEASA